MQTQNKERIRKMFLDELSRWENGRFKGNINWEKSIGNNIKFIYDDIEGEIKIINYENRYLYIKYLNKDIFKISPCHFRECKLGKLLGKTTNEFKINIGTKFNDNKRDLIIIDREYREKIGKNNWKVRRKWYKYKCNKCGWTEGWIEENNLFKGTNCSCCSNDTVILGINTIWDTDRWMCDLGVLEKDAKKYTYGSEIKIKPICPYCKKIKEEGISIKTIHKRHSIGCKCGDNISYPEKFMYSVLLNLDIEFETQKIFKSIDNSYKMFDFYIPLLNCIIETHGEQHYKQSNWKTLQEEQENDKLKEKLAKENGIENYIILDCRKSELEFIKNNILSSKLAELFDLSNINWLKCHEFSLGNLVKIACDFKKENPNLFSSDISKIMKLSSATISIYLKKGNILGWCNYDAKVEKLRGSKKLNKNGKKVEIFKNEISLGIFTNARDLSEKSEELFKIKLVRSGIFNACKNKNHQYKGFEFKFIEKRKGYLENCINI